MLALLLSLAAAAAHTAPAAQPPAPPRVPLRRMLGSMVMARMSGTRPSTQLLRRVRAGRVGGVILFADNVGGSGVLRSTTRRLQRAAHQGGSAGLLVAIDQEGGIVKRLPGPPARSAPAIGATGSASVALHEGRATGRYLAGLGIDVDLAPVVDVAAPGSFIASRSFGSDPRRVARLAGAFADGLGRSGVAATAKHFPGLGRAARNTDTSGSTIDAPLDVLRGDERPFAHAAHAGVPLVMVSTAVYPAFGTRVPAALSSAIVARELRGRLGFRGVTISDDLEAASVRAVTSPAAAAVAAAKAGVDVELLASTPSASEDAYRALLRAARRGELDRASVEAAYNRIAALVAKLEG